MHARAREISLKVNNRLILSKVKGVPCEVDIFKQVLKHGGFGISLLSSGRSDLEGPTWSEGAKKERLNKHFPHRRSWQLFFRLRASLCCDDNQKIKHRTCRGFLLPPKCHHLPWQGDPVNVDPADAKTVLVFGSFKKC